MIKAQVMTITPEIATQFLACNTANYRGINHHKVEQYAREMGAGLWQENGEGIQFYEDGTLANGQHRLSAIQKSGASVQMLVVYGIKKDVYTFDRGGLRTLQQILKAYGSDISSQESSAISILKNGFYGAYGADEIIDYHAKLKDFDVVAFAIKKGDSHPIMNKAGVIAAAYCAYTLGKITLNELETFSKVCNSGVPTENTNNFPPLCFRKTIQNGFKTQNGVPVNGGVAMRRILFETAYRAFCDFHNGAKRKVMYRADGSSEKVLDSVRSIFK